MTRIVAVNGSPRKGWNTDLLVTEAAKGAESAGAEVQYFDLYKLENFTGCASCFGCKRKAHEGECVIKDGLKPVLDAV
ncbi:MAG: flavodoxin family protein, partial [Candidatus Methanomethylophilus sp.]|nr:flavodoxin family protein [Methanomethylophilus sp.]